MTWAELHQKSEQLAAEAYSVLLQAPDRAQAMYAEAARLEEQALTKLSPTKRRTIGITAVSAAALWFKARSLSENSTGMLISLAL